MNRMVALVVGAALLASLNPVNATAVPQDSFDTLDFKARVVSQYFAEIELVDRGIPDGVLLGHNIINAVTQKYNDARVSSQFNPAQPTVIRLTTTPRWMNDALRQKANHEPSVAEVKYFWGNCLGIALLEIRAALYPPKARLVQLVPRDRKGPYGTLRLFQISTRWGTEGIDSVRDVDSDGARLEPLPARALFAPPLFAIMKNNLFLPYGIWPKTGGPSN